MIPDHVAITNLVARYAELLDEGDFAAAASLFAGGEFTGTGGAVVEGEQALAEHLRATIPLYDDGRPWRKHLTTNSQLEIDEAAGTATCQSVFVVLEERPNTKNLRAIAVGRYFDEFRRQGECWHFTSRRRVRDLTGKPARPGDDATGG